MMYSPFYDGVGNPLPLSKVYFRHLGQLKEIEEGYKLEYKSTFDSSVKKKIPAIISSFANSEGGWLIIGIDNDTHEPVCIPKNRTGYDQIISQLTKRVSPVPYYNTKFIRNPKNFNEGVLIVEVYEGQFTPYVSDGTVYVRNGSSKEPVPSQRSTIDYLYQKARDFQDQLKDFCKRTIYFPHDGTGGTKNTSALPICNIYFKNIGKSLQSTILSFDDWDKLTEQVTTAQGDSLFTNAHHTFDSMIFRHRPIDPSTASVTPTMEIFRDLSTKIHIPLGFVSIDERENALEELKRFGIVNGDQINICDGIAAVGCVCGALLNIAAVYEAYHLSISDLAICFELENTSNTALYFKEDSFFDDAKKNGLCVSSRSPVKSKPIFLRDFNNIDYGALVSSLVYDFFLAEFGFLTPETEERIKKAIIEKYPFVAKENYTNNGI